jgi:hypothetical protein
MSFRTFRSPFAITNTLAALQSSIVTNLNVGEILRLSRWAREIKRENIKYQVLNNNENSPFVDKLVNGAYVLLPRDNDWTLLREAAAKLFENAESETIIESESTAFTEETRIDSTIEIKNGNGQSGVAREVASKLSPHGFKIIKIGNANSFDYRQTIIYDLTYGRDSASLKLLKQIFPEVKVADSKTTTALTSSSGADFLIVLGRE